MIQTSMQKAPFPCFDAAVYLDSCVPPDELATAQVNDFEMAKRFLQQYTGSSGTFNSYRCEIERLLHWCWHIAYKTLDALKREDIENFIRFCQRPPAAWIGIKKAPRFLESNGERTPNPEWRPFVATVSKAEFKKGHSPSKKGSSTI